MLLDNCATVSQGSILSRIKEYPASNVVELPLYTMKEMNESLGIEYHGNDEKHQAINVLREKVKDLPITREGMILVNLTGHKAISIRREHTGRLVPSNFAIIEPKDNLNDAYFEWYFNENPFCRKQVRISTQGSIISALSIQMLRTLKIELPTLEKQKMIGNVYRILYQKKRLVSERLLLEEKLIRQLLLSNLKEENN